MTLFARPSVAQKRWWRDLVVHLTPTAQQDYLGVDPANVPAHAVSGEPELVDLGVDEVVVVRVPTDAGTYSVRLVAEPSPSSTWLVHRISPPDTGEH